MNNAFNILIVENDDIDAEFLRRSFKNNGIKNPVYRAYNGVEALDIIRGENGREKISSPYVVLMNINLPTLNGFEVLQELRQDDDLKKTIVFILTTSSDIEDRRKANDLNVTGYFEKKDATELVDLIGLMLNPH